MSRAHILAALAAAAAVAGCGGGDGGDSGSSSEPAGASPAPSESHGAGRETGGAAARGGVRLVEVGSFDAPLFVTAPPGDRSRLFVVEQGGRIQVVRGGRRQARPFLDLGGLTAASGEQGLLGLAFAPDYARSGRFYVNYTDRQGDTRIVEYRRASAERADPRSARLVLRIAQPEPNHNGGWIAFGPDRMLYVGTGDGGGAGDQHGRIGNGQSLSTLLGKLLRIDPRGGRPYAVPKDNPFVGRRGARPEIYAYGLRNPWRASFDRDTGDLVIGDVGQHEVEEIDYATAKRLRGANFGWRVFEGRRRFAEGRAPGHVEPVIEHRHSRGWCSITGGVVVRDPDLPALRGLYVYGDLCRPRIRRAAVSAAGASGQRDTPLRVEQLVSFGEDARGRVYAVSLSGPVYRLAAR